MSQVLEVAVHQFKDQEKAIQWLEHLPVKVDFDVLAEAQWGDFLYYSGHKVKVINNPQYKYYTTKHGN